MPIGPGKYNDACTQARLATDADAIILFVMGGNKGPGFEVQTAYPELAAKLPQILRDVADSIEETVARDADRLRTQM